MRILREVRITELVRASLATVMWKLLAFPSVKIHLYLELSILLSQRDKVKSDGNDLSYSWSRIITLTKSTSRTSRTLAEVKICGKLKNYFFLKLGSFDRAAQMMQKMFLRLGRISLHYYVLWTFYVHFPKFVKALG